MSDTKLVKQITLRGSLPGERADNGIDHLAGALLADPDGCLILAVTVLSVDQVTYRTDTGERRPTLRIDRIEAVPLDEAPQEVRDWMATLAEKRGAGADQDPLPDHLDDWDAPDDPRGRDEMPDHLEGLAAVVPADVDGVVRAPFGSHR